MEHLFRQAILDAPQWTDADRTYYQACKKYEEKNPTLDFHPLFGIPSATRRAILAAGIAAGEVPILGGIGGFDWPDLVALGLARKSYSTYCGEVDSISFCYTGPGFLNVEGTFTTAGKWFDEGGACKEF